MQRQAVVCSGGMKGAVASSLRSTMWILCALHHRVIFAILLMVQERELCCCLHAAGSRDGQT
jgi:hypothetical protein